MGADVLRPALAVNATTGPQRWLFQTVHNDLWDFDVPMQPTFFDFKKPGGGSVPALVFGTKAGQLYVLDRATGKPLTDVVEQPVKPAHIPDEPYALTARARRSRSSRPGRAAITC